MQDTTAVLPLKHQTKTLLFACGMSPLPPPSTDSYYSPIRNTCVHVQTRTKNKLMHGP